MRAAGLLLLVTLVATGGSYLLWRDLLGPAPLGPTRPAPPAPFDPETPEMKALLDTPLPEGFRCSGRRDDCYAAIAQATGVDVRPQWGQMMGPATLDVTRHDATNMELGGLPLRDALLRLATPGPKGRQRPGLIVTGSIVSVTTERAVQEYLGDNDPSLQWVTRVYVVTDLLPSPATVSPEAYLAGVAGLLETLAADARVYATHAGSPGRVRELGGQLVVTHTRARHQEVAWALSRLRWRRGVARFARNTAALTGGAVVLAAVALWVLRRRRLARRVAAGHCVACGYDLRASSGRCPECGQAEQCGPAPVASR